MVVCPVDVPVGTLPVVGGGSVAGGSEVGGLVVGWWEVGPRSRRGAQRLARGAGGWRRGRGRTPSRPTGLRPARVPGVPDMPDVGADGGCCQWMERASVCRAGGSRSLVSGHGASPVV
jgi:hypothetical protein